MIKGIIIGDISIDCKNPESTRNFYEKITGWKTNITYGCPALIADNKLVILFVSCDFEYEPPVWPEESGKEQKQIHLDFSANNLAEDVEKAIQAGAIKSPVQYNDVERCITMIDPEGHPFCLCKGISKSKFLLYFDEKYYNEISKPSINIDCVEMEKLREFYAKLTGWDTNFYNTALITENDMVVHFMGCDFDYIKPVWPEELGKQQKQMHFNFQADNLAEAVDTAVELGAVKAVHQYGENNFITLFDPEGHPFCLCQK